MHQLISKLKNIGVTPSVCNGENVIRGTDYLGEEREVEPCKGLCIPLVSHYNASTSEWFCPECNVSYGMTQGDYDKIAPTVQK